MQTLIVRDIISKDPPPVVQTNKEGEEIPNPKFLEWEENDVLVRS